MANRTIEEIVEEVTFLNLLVRNYQSKKWYQKTIKDRINRRRIETRIDEVLKELAEYERNTNYEQL